MTDLCTTQTAVRRLAVDAFLEQYYRPEKFAQSCNGCPFYGKVWSCPPGVPDTPAFFAGYSDIYLLGVQVTYTELAHRWRDVQAVQDQTYGLAKRALLETQLALEKQFPGARSIAAGRCERCTHCMRPSGCTCIWPERMRYSFSAFRIDLSRLADEQLGFPLQWSSGKLPAYHVALGALLVP